MNKNSNINSTNDPSLPEKLNTTKEICELAENIINTVREPLIVLDKDLRVVKASKSFYDFFKVSPGETVGTLIYNLGNNQWDIPELRDLLETILPEKTTFDNFEVEHIFSVIGKRTMLLNARKIQGDTGNEQIILLAIEDITARKLAEEALNFSETRYRALFESAKDGILILDSESGKIVDVNPFLIDLLGYPKNHFLDKTIWEIGVFKDIVADQNNYMEFKQRGYNRIEHLPLDTMDGRKIDIEFISHVNIADHPRVTQCNIRDITKHKQIEELLRESEERFRHAFEYAAAGVCFMGLDMKFISINSTFQQMFGYSEDEITGLNFSDITHPDDLAIGLDLVKIMMKGESNKSTFEKRYIKKDKSIIWAYISTSLVRDANNQPQFFITQIIDITVRKQLEESLKKQKDEFETIFNLVPAQIWYKDTHNNFLRVNRQTCTDLGISKENIEGHSAEEVFPDFAEKYFKDDLEVFNSGKSKLDVIEQINNVKGELHWVHTDKIPVFADDGKISGLIALVKDITENKLTEEALRNSEALLRTLVQTIPDLIWLKDINGVYLSCNKMFERFFGAAEIDILGKTDYDFVDKELADSFRDNDRIAMEAGMPSSNEELITFKDDGHSAIFDTIKTPLFDFNCKLIGVLGIGRDITYRKKNEEVLQESEEKFRMFTENSADAIFIADNKGNYLYANAESVNLLGYSKEELLSLTILDIVPKNSIEQTSKIFWQLLQDGSVFVEIDLLKKDGNLLPVDLNAVRLPNGSVLASCRDITKRKLAEKELIVAKEKAESANKLKDAFIANISHEIRTPLNGILGMTGLIKSIFQKNIKKEDEELFEGVEYSSQRLIRTVDMMLNYSRMQVGEFPIHPMKFNISDVCQKLVTEYITVAKRKSLDLIFENNCEDAYLLADEYSIILAISNLLDNAIKYTKKGFVKVILYKDKNNDILIDIKDSGIGIDQKFLDYIYKPYTQEQMGYGRAYEGIGLGLSMVQKALALNKGEIFVESKKEKGTTFTLHFGSEVKQSKIICEPLPLLNSHAGNDQFEKELVLLVEDDIINQTTIKRFIDNKYKIIITGSSDEALEILKKNKIELILMDISIQGKKNGLELTKELKTSKEFSHIPIIAITAHAFEKDKNNALAAGCNNFLAKPFSQEALLNMMAVHTDKSILSSSNNWRNHKTNFIPLPAADSKTVLECKVDPKRKGHR